MTLRGFRFSNLQINWSILNIQEMSGASDASLQCVYSSLDQSKKQKSRKYDGVQLGTRPTFSSCLDTVIVIVWAFEQFTLWSSSTWDVGEKSCFKIKEKRSGQNVTTEMLHSKKASFQI